MPGANEFMERLTVTLRKTSCYSEGKTKSVPFGDFFVWSLSFNTPNKYKIQDIRNLHNCSLSKADLLAREMCLIFTNVTQCSVLNSLERKVGICLVP